MILSIILMFSLFVPTNALAKEEKINIYSNFATDADGYRILPVGKQIGLGPASGVYDIITDYYWSSSSPTIMSVVGDNKKANCIVKANSDGTCIVDCSTISVYYLNGTLWDTAVDHNEHKFRVASPVTSLKFNKSKMSMKVGKTVKLDFQTTPNSIYNQYVSGLRFFSSNQNVVSVDNDGYVTAKNGGKATITAKTDNGLKSTIKITVKAPELKSIKFLSKTLTIQQGAKQQLKVKFLPFGAMGKIKWKSSNNKVLKVNNKGVVTAKKSGKATITARVSKKIFAKCKITVLKKPKSIKLNTKNITLEKNKTYNLKYTITPKKSYSFVSWLNSNPSVATVDSKGVIVAKSVGTTNITVKTSNGKTDTCKVTVKNPSATSVTLNKSKITLSVRETDRLFETVLPANSTDKISWSSSNSKVATVDNFGNVKAVGVGIAIISATAESGKSGKCTVEVNNLPLDPNKYLEINAKHDKQDYRTSKTFNFIDNKGLGFTVYSNDATVYTWFNVNPSGWNSDYKYHYSDMENDIVLKNIQAGETYSFTIYYQEFWNMDGAEYSFYILYDGVKYKATGIGNSFQFEKV